MYIAVTFNNNSAIHRERLAFEVSVTIIIQSRLHFHYQKYNVVLSLVLSSVWR